MSRCCPGPGLPARKAIRRRDFHSRFVVEESIAFRLTAIVLPIVALSVIVLESYGGNSNNPADEWARRRDGYRSSPMPEPCIVCVCIQLFKLIPLRHGGLAFVLCILMDMAS